MALAEQVFGFYIPTVSLMGVGCAKEAGAQAKALGATNMLIVTDAGLNKLGVANQIKTMIESAGLRATIFDGAEPNPTDTNVHNGVKAYLKNQMSAHESTVKLFQDEAQSGQDPDIKAFASRTLPTLEDHLSSIKGLQDTGMKK